MKNICFFNGNMSRNGGTERCTALIANELCKNERYKVFIADISNKNDTCFFDVSPIIDVTHIHAGNLVSGIYAMLRYMKRKNIDVIINVEAMLGIYTIPAAKLLGVKNIIWEHGNFYQKQCASIDKVRALEMRLCDCYVTLTERDKKNFKNHFKGKCRIEYIYNPITLPEPEPKYRGNTKTLLSVGLVREIKGFDMLVDVADRVLKKHPDWRWLVYGNKECDPDYTSGIENKIKEYELEDKLVFKGVTKNIYECYKNADIMVMTSRMEGLPMTLLEAKAHKLPIVSFDIETGPGEIIDDGINGYLIKPYDTDAMAEKICALIENDELRRRFSDNAYKGIDKFDIDSIMKKWISVIEG